jgi:hypothetical protein
MVAPRKKWLRDDVPEGRGADPGRPRDEGSRMHDPHLIAGYHIDLIGKHTYRPDLKPTSCPTSAWILASAEVDGGREEEERTAPGRGQPARSLTSAALCLLFLNVAGERQCCTFRHTQK